MLAALALALALAFVLVREDDGRDAFPAGLEAPDAGPVHVHGLGVNPADGALFIATHTGTWRVAADGRTAERVGKSRQDTMGFTIVGPNRFLGSGHPDLEEAQERNLPPLLGLIESLDAGRTWRPISLLGEADFHVLRASSGLVYGYDASHDRLLVSRDAGRTWQKRRHPAPLVDLAVHPANPRRLVASTERGLHSSPDGGATWSAAGDLVGLLAWPEATTLYLVDATGTVFARGAAGTRWRRIGAIGGPPAALLARSSRELYAALHDGTIKRSTDGGATWSVRSAP